ncbi:MAG: hypothetical protein Q9184_006379 [Pyrenodesmia sp. 2 TL-2023]
MMDSQRTSSVDAVQSYPNKSQSPRHWLRPIGFAGFIGRSLQVVFVTFIGQGVTHLKSLGLTQPEISLALLFGPLSGAFIQPYFGTWSDHCRSRWGRRKPFIIVGTLALVISLMCLAWAEPITRFFLSPYAPHQASYRACLIAVTMLSVCCMWVAIQPVQIGLRTLITDGCSDWEQTKANAWATTYNNLAATLANLAAWSNVLPHTTNKSPRDHTVFIDLSVLAVIVLIVTVAISCLAVEEKRLDRGVGTLDTRPSSISRLGAVREILFGGPSQIRTVYLTQFFAWLGWFPLLYYMVIYIERIYILESQTDMPLKGAITEADSRIGSFVLLTFSATSLFAAVLLPTLVSLRSSFTLRPIWIATQTIFASSMLATLIFTSTMGTVVLFSLVGFSWAASNWIPFALLGTELSSCSSRRQLSDGSDDEEKYHNPTAFHADSENLSNNPGLVYGLHNFSICLPQILVTLGMGVISIISDSDSGEETLELAWILRLGGIFSFVAVYLATKLHDV